VADRKVNMNRVQVACVALLACALLVPGRAGYSAETPSELNRRGVELGRQEKYKEALQKFDRSISLYDKSSARTFHNKAWVLELKGETDEAIKNYEEAVRRNPLQVPSHERVGYLYYTTGQYEKAVTTGEYVLEIDPDNREVVKWLSDAYKMRIQQRQEELLARKEKEKKEAEKQPAAEEEKEAEKKQEEQKRLIYVTYDSLFREGYFFGGAGFAYIKDNGAGPDYVNMLHINLTPGTSWELDVLTGNPYLGALTPDMISWTERVQVVYNLGGYSLGLGVWGNHYNSDDNFDSGITMHDYKGGAVFGYNNDKVNVRVLLYPRLLMRDGENSSGRTFDADYFAFLYEYTFDKYLSYYTHMTAEEYYVYDHRVPVSNYYGMYELALGLTLGRYDKTTGERFLSVTVGITERLYMMDLLNDEPYKNFGNGQGWFGINTDKWMKGAPFSGFRSLAHIFSVKVEEPVSKYFFLYQKLMFEVVDGAEDHHEIALQIGVGGQY